MAIESPQKNDKIILANTPKRAEYLKRLKTWVRTKQYEGLPNWFDTSVPMLERAPCIVHSTAKNAIESNVSLVLGSGRFPQIRVDSSEEEASEESAKDGAAAKQQKKIDGFLKKLSKLSKFRRSMRDAFRSAQSIGSAVLIMGVDRKGRPFIKGEQAEWATPTFNEFGEVESLEIKYPYLQSVRGPDGRMGEEVRLYRRVIDAARDITFLPGEANEQGIDPIWKEDPRLSFAHDLGFCPVIWFAFQSEASAPGVIDGLALHADSLEEIRAYDMSVSQRHKAALYAGDPTWTEIGVSEDEGPGATGRTPSIGRDGNPIDGVFTRIPGKAGERKIDFTKPQSRPARKKAAGEIWRYENPETEVELHVLPGDALNAVADNSSDIRAKLGEALGVVFLDPESIKFAATVSGKALAIVLKRQLDRCDEYREEIEDELIVPAMQMLLRIVISRSGDVVRHLPSLKPVYAELFKLFSANDTTSGIELEWGPYFPPDADDDLKRVTTAGMAREKGLISQETGIRSVQSVFGVTSIQNELDALEDESNKAMEMAVNTAKATSEAPSKVSAGKKKTKVEE